MRHAFIHLRVWAEWPCSIPLNERRKVRVWQIRGNVRCGTLKRCLESAGEVRERPMKLQQYRFNGVQTLGLPALKYSQRIFDTFLEAKALPVEFTHSDTILAVRCVGFKSRTHVKRFGAWVCGERLRDNVKKVIGTLDKVSRNGSELRRGKWRFFFGRRFAELERLWPELVEGIVYGLESVSEVPNASQEAFTLGKFLCGLLDKINAPSEPWNVPIEPVDKLLA
jgi:hypothetical protein